MVTTNHVVFLGCTPTDSSYEVGTQFSKETHIRDEDDEMRKFIEIEMDRIKGRKEESDDQPKAVYMSPEDAALLSLPEHLRCICKALGT